ncbi:VOC family protein [Microbacterium sp. MPKO10]|uniref:VOC family protein n=1 Tax=Microbacterium sp. MPKO10 TaxID=2989818 RepID=UPI0022358701|nr:VOC family protein [Microbacterium sp. MPKO10]MCW4459947.1 VOC family protein [Microbacterium sp. MPKO10]
MGRFQIVIDCTDPELLARFWAEALHYQLEPPPEGFDDWNDYWRSVGVPEDELGVDFDSIVDPSGQGPRIWFQIVPEKKSLKNRLHIDVRASGGRSTSLRERKQSVDAEAERLTALGATVTRVVDREGVDHYAIAMRDPEGNEFDIN